MIQRPWLTRIGLPLGVLLLAGGALILVQSPASAGRTRAVGHLSGCAIGDAATATGAWWKTTDKLDASGALAGRELFLGVGASANASAALANDSFVTGPVHGLVAVTTDDGAHSRVILAAASTSCSVAIDERSDVVRTLLMDPADGSVLAHVVARVGRADLGTFRISKAADGTWSSRLVADPLSAGLARRVGPVFGTNLALDRAGTRLAVQSCTDFACLTRVFDLAKPGAAPILLGVDHGLLIGFAGDRLLTWDACTGRPCPIRSWSLRAATSEVIFDAAESAALTADGRRLVVIRGDQAGGQAFVIEPASARRASLRGIPRGMVAIGTSSGAAATLGFEVAENEVAMAAIGGDPLPLNPDTAATETLP